MEEICWITSQIQTQVGDMSTRAQNLCHRSNHLFIFRMDIKIRNLSLKLFASAKALSFYSKLHVFCQLSNWCVWVKIHNEFIRAHSSNQKGCRFNYWACAKPALLRLLETCLCNLIKVNKWHAQTWPWRAIKTEL